MEVVELSLFDVNWEDVMFPKILSYLSVDDLFRLRATCTQANVMVIYSLSKYTILFQ